MCIANYGSSEAVNLCSTGARRNPPNVRNKNAPVLVENKISCSLTIVYASSFRPSQYYYFIVMISICFSSAMQSHIICKKCTNVGIWWENHLYCESLSLIGWDFASLSLIGGFWITLNVPERMVARSSMETLSMSPSNRPALWMGSASKRKISSTESAALGHVNN